MTDVVVQECFSCGRSYTVADGRFCSARCREWFDAGNPPYDPAYAIKSNPRWYSLPMGTHGFLIPCAHCRKTFDSKGLRCCSAVCEKRYREREDNLATLAEAGMERAVKRKCVGCDDDIPSWINPGTPKARRVPITRRFCSRKCQYRAKIATAGG
jgi:hypothetical protein